MLYGMDREVIFGKGVERMKRFILLLVILLLAFVVVACQNAAAEDAAKAQPVGSSATQPVL